MFIDFSFVVNGYNLKKSTISVTYTPVDDSLNLMPYTIQQLGVERGVLAGFQSGDTTIDELKFTMRQLIIAAGSRAQYEWQVELATRDASLPEILAPMFGAAWDVVTETEATGLIEVTI